MLILHSIISSSYIQERKKNCQIIIEALRHQLKPNFAILNLL